MLSLGSRTRIGPQGDLRASTYHFARGTGLERLIQCGPPTYPLSRPDKIQTIRSNPDGCPHLGD
jgi:hypothetical protein